MCARVCVCFTVKRQTYRRRIRVSLIMDYFGIGVYRTYKIHNQKLKRVRHLFVKKRKEKENSLLGMNIIHLSYIFKAPYALD